MIDGIILGFITWLSMVFTFQHLPKVFRELLLNNPLIADIIATSLCFFFLASISQSILSVVGSITCGLLVNFTLIIYNTYRKTYEQE
jgi:hypothetical protein